MIFERFEKNFASKKTQFFTAVILIVGSVFLAYSNSFKIPFIFDDLAQIADNDSLHRLWPISNVISNTSRPIPHLTFALNYAFGKLNVFGFRLVNIIIHIFSALVLFGILRRTLRLRRFKSKYKPASLIVSFFIAFIWALHPLHTEVIDCTVHRIESMMGFFYLATLYSFIRGATSSHKKMWYLISIFSCFSGMASKEVMVSVPIIVFIYDRLFMASSLDEIMKKRGQLYLGYFLSWALLFLLIMRQPAWTQKTIGFGIEHVTPLTYLLTESKVLLHYLRLSVWPFGLCIDYAWPFVHSLNEAAFSFLIVCTLFCLTVFAIFHKRSAGFLGAWFFLILAPTSSILPIVDAAAERRMYLPLISIVIFFVLGVYELINADRNKFHRRRKQFTYSIFCITAVSLGVITFFRNMDYKTSISIWEDTVKKRSGNGRALNNLSRELLNAGRYEDAYGPAKKAAEIYANYPEAQNNFANVLMQKREFKEAEKYYLESIKIDPESYFAYFNYGLLLLFQNRLEEASFSLQKAIEIKPALSNQMIEKARIYAKKNDLKKAEAILFVVTLKDSKNSQAQFDLANVLAREGKTSEATLHYQVVIELMPYYGEAYNNLGMVLFQEGKKDEAVKQLLKAIEVKPSLISAYKNVAEIFFQQGDFEKGNFYLQKIQKSRSK